MKEAHILEHRIIVDVNLITSAKLKNQIYMKDFTEKEKDLLRTCVLSQISNNNKAKELVSDFELYKLIENKNKELISLLDKVKNL